MRDFSAKGISKAMTGQDVLTTRIAPKLKKTKKNVLEVKNLSSRHTFEGINLTIAEGEILGVTGLLGSGRTELAEAIFGKYPVDSGDIFVNGKKIKSNSSRDALQAGIGYVPPDRLTQGLFLEQSILRNLVAVGIDSYRSGVGILSPRKLGVEGDRWISDLRIKTKNPLNPVTSLSGGNQQRVVLAKWLAMNPKIMILNGPTVGVDVGSKREILEIIKERATQGMSFLVVSDDIPELIQICHRVVVIKNGRISREFEEDELKESSLYKEIN
jgi:simple sugar transport system ATP-binding protein